MWNADPEATRKTYQRRIDTAWDEYEREWRRQPRPAPMPNYMPWIILQRPSAAGRGPAARPAAPAGQGRWCAPAQEAVAPLERMADDLTRGVEQTISGTVQRIEQGVSGLLGGGEAAPRRRAMTPATRPATARATRPACTMPATRPACTTPAIAPATRPACATAPATARATRPA